MSSTVFIPGTTITPTWLNDVDLAVWGVNHFGAVGDGVADDTAAIQAAITAAQPSVASILANKITTVTAEVYFPPGVYNITSLNTYNGIRMRGAGQGLTVLKYTGSGAAITINKVATEELYATQFEDFTLWDQGTGTYGIIGEDGTNLAIRACGMRNVTVYGFNTNVFLDECFTFYIENSILQNAVDYCLHIKNATNFFAKGSRFDVAGDDCVLIEDGSSGNESIAPMFLNCTMQSANKWGLHGIDVVNCHLINCFIEANNRNASAIYGGIYFEDGPNLRGKYFKIEGGFFTPGNGTSGQTGIKIDRASQVSINTHMRGNGIGTGVRCEADVIEADIRGVYAVTTPTSSAASRTTQQINGEQIIVLGEGMDVGAFAAGDAQMLIGENGGGQILLGHTGPRGCIQGAGTGTSFDMDINPYAGMVQLGTPVWRTTLTSSNYVTNAATRNRGVASIGIDCSGGNRSVTIASSQIERGGAMWFIWKQGTDGNTLTVETEGSETINGSATISSTASRVLFIVWSDGVNLHAKTLT